MIKISAFADEAFVSLDEQIAFLRSLGLKWLEIRFVDGKNISSMTESEVRAAKKKLDDAGIGISAVASPVGKYSLSEPFMPHLDLMKKVAEIADILGTSGIRIFSFYPPQDIDVDRCWDQVEARLEKLAETVSGSGTVLLHENESSIFGHSAENCARIGKRFFRDNFALAYDPANFVWGEGITDNVDRCWPLMKEYVRHIHLKDWKLGSKDVGSLLGDGDAQIRELVHKSLSGGYSGFMVLEPHMSSGGRFGGSTSPAQFRMALDRIRGMLDNEKVEYE